jgi:4-hydroxy-tetrahydrodipicolinate reductase
MIRVCVAGVTGWVGRALAPALAADPGFELVGAVARSSAGRMLADVVGGMASSVRIAGSVEQALDTPTDVLIDYTSADAVRHNALAAISRGVHCVIGSSGLTETDFRELDAAAGNRGVGVLAAGNFAISAVLLQHFAVLAARYMPSWEIVDIASAAKPDAPSGTARELAFRLGAVGRPYSPVPVAETRGAPEARGTTLSGTQVHSIRLPGYVIGVEALFGCEGETLTLRTAAGESPAPYVAGTLLAAWRVHEWVGVRRGLASLLDLP